MLQVTLSYFIINDKLDIMPDYISFLIYVFLEGQKLGIIKN